MACRTGDACGFTDTRSPALRCWKYSAVMMLTIEAEEAWCPPTFRPERVVRARLAWWTMLTASHRTRRWILSRTSSVSSSELSSARTGAPATMERR